MESTLEEALAELEASADLETFFQTSFVLLKILQNIVSTPEDDKYRRIRRASKLLSQSGAEDVLRTVGFQEEGDFLVCSLEDDGIERLVGACRFIVSYRRRYNELSAWEIPTGSLTFNERVGKGKFGEVYRGSWDMQPVAIKTLRPKCEDYAVEQFKKEANIMRQCKHTNILFLRAVCLFVEPSYLVLDLMKCCYLDLLREGALSQREILDHITQVAAGVEYLHHLDILHCDIAARNILLDFHGVLKISDFGMARFDHTPECNAALQPGVFPTRWTAPEVFTRGTLSKHSDVWGFGITFYEFVSAGGVPYAEFTNKDTKQKVLEGYRLEQPADCPDKFYEIMMKCWDAKPNARPTITEISQSLLSFKAERAETLRPKITLSQTSLESVESTPSPMLEVQDFPAGGLSPQSDGARRNSGTGMKKSKSKSRRVSMQGVKIDKLLCVYTMLVSPFHSQVILRVKSKQKASDMVTTALKKVGKEKADPSMFALVEVFDPEGSETRGMPRYLGDKEQPLVVKRDWTKRGRFFLCNRVGSSSEALLDALNVYLQQSDNAAKMQYKTHGYLIKFDEYVGGTKGRNVSRNWSRYWTLLDGSTMLFYKDEEDEEDEPLLHLSVKGCCVEPASDYTKKKGVFRLTTENGDRYLLHSSNKDDMYRWVEAVHSVRLDPASIILEKFGSGEVLKSGFLNVTCHSFEPDTSGEQQLGRNWFVLKDQHMSYFRQGERLVAIDFNSCVKILVRTPSIVKDYDEKKESMSSLLSFGIEVVLSSSKFWMKPDTPGEQEEWLAAFEKALTPIGKADVISLVEPGDVFQEQGSDVSAAPAATADNYVKFRRAEGFQPFLPRLSEEDDGIRSGPTSPIVQVDGNSVDAAELARSPRSPIPEIEGVSKSSSGDSVIIRLQRSLSQRKGGGYSVRSKLIKAGLDESVVYGPDSSKKTHQAKLSMPDIDELPPPPPPENLVVPAQVADLPSPPDDLPPPPPPDLDESPPSLPVKSWKSSSEFLSGPMPPSVDRQTKPRLQRAQTADSCSAAGFHGDGDYVRMERFQRSQTIAGHLRQNSDEYRHPRQSSDEYVTMHQLSNGSAGQGLVIEDPNYVAMAPYVGSQPIQIGGGGGSYVRMAAIATVSAPVAPAFPTKKTSPLLGRRTTSSHQRQDSLDGGTPGVLLYPSPSPARTPSPTSSPKVPHDSHYRRDDSSVGSTPGSSAPSTPQPIAFDDPFMMPKGPRPDLFSSPRRTIGDMGTRGESPRTAPVPRDLPAAAGVGYTRVGTVYRQTSSPSMIRRAATYSHQTSVSPPEDIPRGGSFSSMSSDQYVRERSDSMLSRSSTGSQRSQSSLSGLTKGKPLPAGWKSNASTNGRLYYYNSATGQRTWHINEVWALVKSGDYTQTSMAPGWEAVLTAEGRTYYYHKETKRTTWNIVDTWK